MIQSMTLKCGMQNRTDSLNNFLAVLTVTTPSSRKMQCTSTVNGCVMIAFLLIEGKLLSDEDPARERRQQMEHGNSEDVQLLQA